MITLRKLTHTKELRAKQPILVGTITSGDHPIQWEVYKDWSAWVRDQHIDTSMDFELDAYEVYELPYSDSYHRYSDHPERRSKLC